MTQNPPYDNGPASAASFLPMGLGGFGVGLCSARLAGQDGAASRAAAPWMCAEAPLYNQMSVGTIERFEDREQKELPHG